MSFKSLHNSIIIITVSKCMPIIMYQLLYFKANLSHILCQWGGFPYVHGYMLLAPGLKTGKHDRMPYSKHTVLLSSLAIQPITIRTASRLKKITQKWFFSRLRQNGQKCCSWLLPHVFLTCHIVLCYVGLGLTQVSARIRDPLHYMWIEHVIFYLKQLIVNGS